MHIHGIKTIYTMPLWCLFVTVFFCQAPKSVTTVTELLPKGVLQPKESSLNGEVFRTLAQKAVQEWLRNMPLEVWHAADLIGYIAGAVEIHCDPASTKNYEKDLSDPAGVMKDIVATLASLRDSLQGKAKESSCSLCLVTINIVCPLSPPPGGPAAIQVRQCQLHPNPHKKDALRPADAFRNREGVAPPLDDGSVIMLERLVLADKRAVFRADVTFVFLTAHKEKGGWLIHNESLAFESKDFTSRWIVKKN